MALAGVPAGMAQSRSLASGSDSALSTAVARHGKLGTGVGNRAGTKGTRDTLCLYPASVWAQPAQPQLFLPLSSSDPLWIPLLWWLLNQRELGRHGRPLRIQVRSDAPPAHAGATQQEQGVGARWALPTGT